MKKLKAIKIVVLNGHLQRRLSPDVILKILGDFEDIVTEASTSPLEFHRAGQHEMRYGSPFTAANIPCWRRSKCGLFEADEKTAEVTAFSLEDIDWICVDEDAG